MSIYNIIEVLELLPSSFKSKRGLCANFFSRLPLSYTNKMFRAWEHFSGNTEYPVPATRKSMSSSDAYLKFNMYNRRSKYGALRWNLVAHCIKYMHKNPNLRGRQNAKRT